MAQLNLTLPVIFLFLFSNLATARRIYNPQTIALIRSSCHATLYPNLCKRCLSKFANFTIQNPQQLAHVALSVSLSRAVYTRGYLQKVAEEFRAAKNNNIEYLIVQDCLKQISDSVDQLNLSIKELRRLDRRVSTGAGTDTIINDAILWHISNVETWVSTALTDASTCGNSFPGRQRMSKLKATIKVKALNVAQVTSNALAIFHGYAAKYRAAAAARATKKP